MDRTEIWLILGASGGIGRAVTEAAAQDNRVPRRFIGTHCHSATCQITADDAAVEWHRLDYLKPSSVDRLATWCNKHLARIDRLVCATGVLESAHLRAEKRINQVSLTSMQQLMQINAFGPMLLLAQLEPVLRRSPRARIVCMSAQVGSIDDNRMGGWYSYRMSKSALNMGVKSLAIETGRWRAPPIISAVHPGTTLTNLSRPFIQNRRNVKSSSTTGFDLLRFIEQIDESHHGGFFRLNGNPLAW